jgi:type I restriction enzyme, S subunit
VKPRTWQRRLLGDGIVLLSGRHILSEDYAEEPQGIPYLTGPSDFIDGKIKVTKYTEKPKVVCEEGDILLTVKGSGTGKIIKADQKYCISRQLMAIRVKSWNSDFIYYQLQQY